MGLSFFLVITWIKTKWILHHQHRRQVKMHFSLFLCHRLCPLRYVFIWNISLMQRKFKLEKSKGYQNSSEECVTWMRFKFLAMKIIFWKEFGYSLFTKLPKIIVVSNFWSSPLKLKKVSYLPWQNNYFNLRTTYYIKQKRVLWTKLLENMLLAKYSIPIPVPLKN